MALTLRTGRRLVHAESAAGRSRRATAPLGRRKRSAVDRGAACASSSSFSGSGGLGNGGHGNQSHVPPSLRPAELAKNDKDLSQQQRLDRLKLYVMEQQRQQMQQGQEKAAGRAPRSNSPRVAVDAIQTARAGPSARELMNSSAVAFSSGNAPGLTAAASSPPRGRAASASTAGGRSAGDITNTFSVPDAPPSPSPYMVPAARGGPVASDLGYSLAAPGPAQPGRPEQASGGAPKNLNRRRLQRGRTNGDVRAAAAPSLSPGPLSRALDAARACVGLEGGFAKKKAKYDVLRVQPRELSDCWDDAMECIRRKKILVLIATDMSRGEAQRAVDALTGACVCMTGGRVDVIGERVYMFSPSSCAVAEGGTDGPGNAVRVFPLVS